MNQDQSEIISPPTSFGRILLAVGPGLIVAGSIVGSGELIATTKTGAESGFSLLWLIVIGCVIKVFAQIEFGRYALISGKTTLVALDEVPGPRIKGRGNWLVWYWLIMWLASISQLGGIVGGVGQALSISAPLTQQGVAYNQAADAEQLARFDAFRAAHDRGESEFEVSTPNTWVSYDASYQPATPGEHRQPHDTAIWAILISLITSVILVVGRYNLIQSFSTALVASFTLLVVVNVYWLQSEAEFAFSAKEFLSGLMFSFPEKTAGVSPIRTALATFGIIGVGAAELITYPYWCLEKGYGKFTGKNDGSQAWKQRAAGWMRVMHVDAWGAMLIYTFATIAFYLLGASVLHRIGLNPEKGDMVRTLAVMFQPVFSEWAATVFLFGALAVLYSTFFVANASHARTFSDALRVIGLIAHDEQTRDRWIRILSGVFPILCVVIFIAFPAPAQLVLISGIAQGIMLPMLAAAALFFRYKRSVEGLEPNKLWDTFLWLSAAAMLVTGAWTFYAQFI
ncbi:Nramp family divalent metal transporter [Stieleria magnilauensis]|uniref:Manganese transport protein MntH n=1 Tax=Stieleria magnilauensis TaxID=2527963 RepID=A0ABX5XKU4_9BACT|nr:manganese transport protein MntH [Planctomycetes bacterium TBK1r]